MPLPTPFHSRTSAICYNQEWREWAGYFSAVIYEPYHEHEYYAIRSAAGLLDVSPLFKYEVTGPQAERLLDRVMTRDITRCQVGQVMYSPWCDEEGKVVDDGTVARLGENHFRITAADPNLRWFQDVGYGLDAEVADVSEKLAALALQGPTSRLILKQVFPQANLDSLKYYWLTQAELDGIPLTLTRTGYTGDLGYELWIAPQHAERLWDRLIETGQGYGITPFGLAALDIARVEAGLLLLEVDYISSHKALIESQKSSPFDIGLAWTVDLDGADFIGKRALVEEQNRDSQWSLVGLDINWGDLEERFGKLDLPPQVAGRTSRAAVPIYLAGRQIGQATSLTFSPLLKRYIALATIERRFAKLGSEVEVEITVEYARQRARATLTKLPFFNPPRKRGLADE